ncbi:nuclear transport factor 2 family protein [Nocardia sp. NPDC059195]|uniref:nuclear transport factor 2 family protein n=1 Tax=Nocardia sp. NPDC059195 TaxID=3346765 RepID=UPI0036903F84
MTIPTDQLSDPAVRALVAAVNSDDRSAFDAALTAGATMSDDGNDRDVTEWADKEVFSSSGHMDVQSESDGGLSLIVDFRNDIWGAMRTAWRFDTTDGRVSRFETGQA